MSHDIRKPRKDYVFIHYLRANRTGAAALKYTDPLVTVTKQLTNKSDIPTLITVPHENPFISAIIFVTFHPKPTLSGTLKMIVRASIVAAVFTYPIILWNQARTRQLNEFSYFTS